MAEEGTKTAEPTNSKDDEMANKLMEELKSQGVDVSALKNGEKVDVKSNVGDSANSEGKKAEAPSQAPTTSTTPEAPKTDGDEKKLEQVTAETKKEEKSEKPTTEEKPKTDDDKKEGKNAEEPKETEITKKEIEADTKEKSDSNVAASQDQASKTPAVTQAPTSASVDISGIDMSKEEQLIPDSQIVNDIEKQSYITFKISKTILAIIIIFIIAVGIELAFKFIF